MIEYYGLLQKYGKIDVVVSNAAANPSVDAILQTKDSVLDKLWEINVKATILLLKVNSLCEMAKTKRRKKESDICFSIFLFCDLNMMC